MLLQQGPFRSERADRNLACCLALVAGGVNTAAFEALGFFSANMTGNVSTLSVQLSRQNWLAALFYLSIVLAFVLGALVSTLVINAGRRRHIQSVYAITIGLEAFLMATLGIALVLFSDTTNGEELILGLSFTMGLQNAVVTRISDARVRTTHISGMSTDIGIELSILIDTLRGKAPITDRPTNLRKLRLHSQTLVAFLLGGIVGAFLYRVVGNGFLFVAAATLSLLAGNAIWKAQKMPPTASMPLP